jgi:recombination protein RecT
MTNTDVATAPKHPLVILRERFEQRRDELKNMLPSDVSPDRFIRAVITSAQLNPDILACQWSSLWTAALRACRDGLLPDGREGAIVPFKSTASWIPMYQGLLKRFRRSGQFRWIKADVVREGEEFYHYVDEHGEHIRHTPGDNFDAPILKIYAMATTKDGGVFVNVMSIAEANKIKAMSKATREDAPWKVWPEEMLRKTALRRLSKVLPSEGDLPDDDVDSIEAPALAPPGPGTMSITSEPPRARGAAAALDQFAASAPDADQVSHTADDAEAGEPADIPNPLTSSKDKSSKSASAS